MRFALLASSLALPALSTLPSLANAAAVHLLPPAGNTTAPSVRQQQQQHAAKPSSSSAFLVFSKGPWPHADGDWRPIVKAFQGTGRYWEDQESERWRFVGERKLVCDGGGADAWHRLDWALVAEEEEDGDDDGDGGSAPPLRSSSSSWVHPGHFCADHRDKSNYGNDDGLWVRWGGPDAKLVNVPGDEDDCWVSFFCGREGQGSPCHGPNTRICEFKLW